MRATINYYGKKAKLKYMPVIFICEGEQHRTGKTLQFECGIWVVVLILLLIECLTFNKLFNLSGT